MGKRFARERFSVAVPRRAESATTLVLPPGSLRPGHVSNQDDAGFVANARLLVDSVASMLNRDEGNPDAATQLAGKRIIDIGCGPLRFLVGLRSRAVRFREYVGVDVKAEPIDWANEHASEPSTRFYRIDMHNERYNPRGRRTARVHLPEDDGSFDLIVLRSVFTHMRLADMEAYLPELWRILDREGSVYVSAFVEDGVPAETENPPGYRGESGQAGPLHQVRIERGLFEALLQRHGFEICGFRREVLGQPTYLLRKRGVSAPGDEHGRH